MPHFVGQHASLSLPGLSQLIWVSLHIRSQDFSQPLTHRVLISSLVDQFRAADTAGQASKNLTAPKTPEDTSMMLMNIIDAAKRETHGGEFVNFDGSQLPW